MSLAAGARLGPYEIVSPLGAGGMGEVYRARDTRLERTVAIKVLPSHLAADPQFRSRFEREARSISQLSHPHICTLHDIGRHEGVDYLVLEFLDGESLTTRLAHGALPVDDALQIAIEIASALDAAHRAGIVHRDLKPGNVLLTRSAVGRPGVPQAKLLDFGLAKSSAPVVAGAAMAATAAPVTAQGAILGTFQYMAPEQLEGKEADVRSDIWAFGCVVYELLTGRRPFDAASHAGLITSIMGGEPPPIGATAPGVPRDVQRLLGACLAKNPEERWQSSRDLLRELEWIRDRRADAPSPALSRRTVPLLVTLAAIVALLAAAPMAILHLIETRVPVRSMQFSLTAAGDVAFSPIAGGIVISPDGEQIAFVGEAGITRALWVRPIDALESRLLPGTEGAITPFWSPDSRSLGFVAAGKIKVVNLVTGTVEAVAGALPDATIPSGASWGADGTILYSSDKHTLFQIPASGGRPSQVLSLDTARKESAQRWPIVLPDGRHFLYLSSISTTEKDNAIYLASFDSPERQRLLDIDSQLVYSSAGYLLYARSGALVAHRFDLSRLALGGEPQQVAASVDQNRVSRAVTASVSNTGTLIYRPGLPAQQDLIWVDRAGRRLGTVGASDQYFHPSLSPDETRLAVAMTSEGRSHVWVIDLQRGTRSRITRHPAGGAFPVWSPDGQHLIFESNRDGAENLYRTLSTGAGDELPVYVSETPHKHVHQWSDDGRFVLFDVIGDVWAAPMERGGKPFAVLTTDAIEGQPRLSPDSRWIAYTSNETGRPEVYVQTFPPSGPKVQISTSGGGQPRWRADGAELYYIALERRLMAVAVKARDRVEAGLPQALFETPLWHVNAAFDLWTPEGLYVPTRKGDKFLFLAPIEAARTVAAGVITNWTGPN